MLGKKCFFNKKTWTILISAVVILGALIAVVATGAAHDPCTACGKTGLIGEDACETCGGLGKIFSSIWALLPPIIAIGLALITKEVFSSLFVGILSGAIIAADFAPLKTVDHVISTGLISAVEGTAGIFVFLVELGGEGLVAHLQVGQGSTHGLLLLILDSV